jgi:hypothetical protein
LDEYTVEGLMDNYGKFSECLEEADRDFRTDVSYAVAVAKAARTIAAKRSMWQSRRLTDSQS